MYKQALRNSTLSPNADSVKLVAEVRPYSLKKLCNLYKMSYKAMYRCLKPLEDLLGEKEGITIP
ncbi:MAG TPA: hypothetical protein PKG65_14275 [Ferruginibacter sp.]|nr:hypothetical protein [Ferruginibacter sp.]